jgi:acyl carrier protein
MDQVMNESQQIRQFILKNFLFTDDDSSLSDSSSLIASGTIDSTGVLELIMFVEEAFKIAVAEEEMVPDNLESVDKIVRYVRSKRAAAGT